MFCLQSFLHKNSTHPLAWYYPPTPYYILIKTSFSTIRLASLFVTLNLKVDDDDDDDDRETNNEKGICAYIKMVDQKWKKTTLF